MKTQIVKIQNIEHLPGEISIFENSGYIQCNRKEATKTVTFKETDYDKQQKTIYFK